MKTKNFIILFVGVLFLISSCVYDEIKQNKGNGTAQIIGNEIHYRNGAYFLKYKYVIDGKTYYDETSNLVRGKYLDDYMFKYFPIVYSTKNPEKSIILISPDDFERWGMEFPDSLNWVKDKLEF